MSQCTHVCTNAHAHLWHLHDQGCWRRVGGMRQQEIVKTSEEVLDFDLHHQRVDFANLGDIVKQVMEDSGLKKTQVERYPERCSS